MFTRLKKRVQASRERKREQVARDLGSLSKQEREDVRRLGDEHSPLRWGNEGPGRPGGP